MSTFVVQREERWDLGTSIIVMKADRPSQGRSEGFWRWGRPGRKYHGPT